jgi:uncharacterized membrane protein
MELSIYLAKLLGIYMLLLAGAWIVRKDQLDRVFKEIASSRSLLAFLGIFDIVAGLAIAIGHPVWQFNWRGLITLLGYVMIVRGLMRLMFTDEVKKRMATLMDKGGWIIIAILVVIGAFLTYNGFASPQ